MLNPPVKGKFKDFSRPLSVFQILFKANLIFKDFSRQSCIFKYFSSLREPCIHVKCPGTEYICDWERENSFHSVPASKFFFPIKPA